MPFQSEKQRRYLWANEPKIARDWTDTYGSRIQKNSGGITSWADQGGMKNYLGNQPMVDAPKYWRSGPNSPPTELAYITDAEKDMIMKTNLHGSLSGGPNEGPSGIMSLDSQGDYTPDRSPGSGSSGRGPSAQASEAHMRSILTGQKNIGQTSRVSDRVRRGAVPEYVNTPGGMKYLGSAYKDTGRRSFLSKLFGGSNRYGYSPVRGLKNLGTRGVPGQRGYEYYSDDEEIGETKPGYGGRILGGLMSLLTGVPFVGGAIGSAYDYGKGIFSKNPRDMSQFNKYGLGGSKDYLPQGTLDFDPNALINQSTSVPMDRMDRWSQPISRSPMSDPMWDNRNPLMNKGIMTNSVLSSPNWQNMATYASVSPQDLARYSQQGDLTRATDYGTAMDTIYQGSKMTPYEYQQLQQGNITAPGVYPDGSIGV